MSGNVNLEAILGGQDLFAQVARIPFALPCREGRMFLGLVGVELAFLGKGFITPLATIGLGPGMNPVVDVQISPTEEPLFTALTGEISLPQMALPVGIEFAFPAG